MTTGQIHSAQIRSAGATRLTGCHEAIFPWWSFTKTLIAVAAMRLVEQGNLNRVPCQDLYVDNDGSEPISAYRTSQKS